MHDLSCQHLGLRYFLHRYTRLRRYRRNTSWWTKHQEYDCTNLADIRDHLRSLYSQAIRFKKGSLLAVLRQRAEASAPQEIRKQFCCLLHECLQSKENWCISNSERARHFIEELYLFREWLSDFNKHHSKWWYWCQRSCSHQLEAVLENEYQVI